MEKMPLKSVKEQLAEVQGWELEDEKWLIKKYRFRSFLDSISFVNEIAKLSEEENHHPFISVDFKVVTLKLTSWRAKGITELDLKLIKKYDSLFGPYQINTST
ncbi:4a-hydroxytetrahydrobiopterin dehydratase [Mesobacillus foraminis]|uniref:4a-hydroxytetrahydrobiopterin dehydratase n=1 Tax=Mesobacillus foraminis TaxID=279826 RepID=UPI001BE92242|nr:4a-hydroxytetrahydrobiopterin dehydratase [Mesobacillus foraminis]MBT2755183.1 4a-hydroxytetrahydrobiopterin dehydratase [Mesobacillus foraminis]